jgi:uncharacterized membrane protein
LGTYFNNNLIQENINEIQENKMTREVEDMIKFSDYNILDSFVNTIHFFVSSMLFARNLNRKRRKII